MPQPFWDRDDPRSRLLTATVRLIGGTGIHAVSVADVAKHARVSRAAFYQRFEELEDAAEHAYREIVDWFAGEMDAAFRVDAPWPQRIARLVDRGTELLHAHPGLAQFLFHDGPECGTRTDTLREEARRRFEPFLDDAWIGLGGADLPRSTNQATVATAFELMGAAIRRAGPQAAWEARDAALAALALPFLPETPPARA